MPVPFRFDAILRVREAERDKCRQALADAQQFETSLIAQGDQCRAENQTAIEELRALHAQEMWSPEQDAVRRAYCEQLTKRMEGIDASINDASSAVAARCNELLEADTAVKGLRKLASQHSANQQQADQAAEQRERDDTWRAA